MEFFSRIVWHVATHVPRILEVWKKCKTLPIFFVDFGNLKFKNFPVFQIKCGFYYTFFLFFANLLIFFYRKGSKLLLAAIAQVIANKILKLHILLNILQSK